MTRRLRRGVVFLLLAILGTLLSPSSGTAETREFRIKAAYLYHFGNFIEWPKNAFPEESTPFTIAVIGDDPFGSALDNLRRKQIHGRQVAIKRFQRVQDIDSCHILYISSSESGRIPEILRQIQGRAVLTVSDMEGFARGSGMVNFVEVENRFRFEINQKKIEQSGAKASARLLRVGTVVQTGQP